MCWYKNKEVLTPDGYQDEIDLIAQGTSVRVFKKPQNTLFFSTI